MSTRPVGTRRPRLLPRALLASGLVVAAACTTLAVTAGPPRQNVQTCPTNQQWVTIEPASIGVTGWESHAGPAAPTLAGCVDTRSLPSQPGRADSRG
jgi:hypothetical protein